ncbi:1,4-alpha-glucan branching protein [Gordonia sp. ABSL1-1]|uniref:maltokinase N-terminal cap-like domain-containing protein n=1 Tax=Gordonia sp. ABSL1-1 TaxID=3053923 RepID=UPI00257305B8|nr:1,4-alpha-glucan branching protein [Gordonia sp. ABSL1-1]MDL9937577.1 1,4-alpha-glucan branching protein [Gordonia sp. ABSL1-1]
MAVIHNTTMVPGKLDLLTEWLPTREWYRGLATPNLRKAGGFRLDDPAGQVGIEVMIVVDLDDAAPTAESPAYLVPMTYRDAPLPGAELIGTSTHGVLGLRYIYDATTDPVFVDQFAALGAGRVPAQAQSVSNQPDPTVGVSVESGGRAGGWSVVRVLAPGSAPDAILADWTDAAGLVRRGPVAIARPS